MGIADKSHFFIEQELIEIIYCQYYPAIWGVISILFIQPKCIEFIYTVNTPQLFDFQYTPALEKRMELHCLDSG